MCAKKKSVAKKPVSKKATVSKVESITPSSKIVLNASTIEKAVAALSKWNANKQENGEKSALIEEDDDELPLFLQVTSTKFFAKEKQLKVEKLSLPHSIYEEDLKVCVFTKDGLISEEILQEIEAKELPHLEKIISVQELKTTYKPYQSRRKLLSEFDVFLVDGSIIPLMPKLLGKIFYQSAKLPMTIKITNEKKFDMESFESNYKEALTCVPFILPMGNNMTFRLGMLGQEISNLVENLNKIAEYLGEYQIRALQFKLKDSPSLPIYMVDQIYDKEDVTENEELDADNEKNAKRSAAYLEEKRLFEEGLAELGVESESKTKSNPKPKPKTRKRAASSASDKKQTKKTKTA